MVSEGKEKINLKQDTNSHGLVSLRFLSALGIFLGIDKSMSGDLDFQAVSNLILDVNFQIKHSTLLNRKRKEEEDNESILKMKEEHDFFEWPDQFEEELVEDLYKGYLG